MWYSNGKDTDIVLWILLTSTALVAFAGAAAAGGHTSVSFSGAASAEYNSLLGYGTDADLYATMSADLDNGLTVSTKISIDTTNFTQAPAAAVVAGTLTLSSDAASLSFGTALHGAAFEAVSDTIAIGDGDEGVSGVSGSYSMGAATLFVSMPLAATDTTVDSTDIELGVTAAAGAMTVGFGMADSNFVGKVSGTAAGASFTVAAGSVADVTVWDVTASYPVGAVTVGFTVDSTAGNPWEVSAAYAAGAVSADVSYNSAESYDIEVSYDMGNGVVVSAGMLNSGDDTYIGGAYELGAGASAYASYVTDTGVQNADNEIGAKDYARGTTVGVSFTF